MVSKLIVAGILFGAAFASYTMDIKSENFKSAICTKSYKEHTEKSKDLKVTDFVNTHGCSSEKHKYLCVVYAGDGEYLTCADKDFDSYLDATFTLVTNTNKTFTIHEHDVKEVTKIACFPALHTYKPELEYAVRAMAGKKESLKALGEVKETDTNCFVVFEEEETKKEGEKKEGEDTKEAKKISKVYWFTVKDKKDYKPTEKVEELTIFEKKYKGLLCGKNAYLEKEAKAFEKEVKAFEKSEESSGCCSCAWYVWLIISVVILAAGAGAYVILKADEDEDEFANEYSA